MSSCPAPLRPGLVLPTPRSRVEDPGLVQHSRRPLCSALSWLCVASGTPLCPAGLGDLRLRGLDGGHLSLWEGCDPVPVGGCPTSLDDQESTPWWFGAALGLNAVVHSPTPWGTCWHPPPHIFSQTFPAPGTPSAISLKDVGEQKRG